MEIRRWMDANQVFVFLFARVETNCNYGSPETVYPPSPPFSPLALPSFNYLPRHLLSICFFDTKPPVSPLPSLHMLNLIWLVEGRNNKTVSTSLFIIRDLMAVQKYTDYICLMFHLFEGALTLPFPLSEHH